MTHQLIGVCFAECKSHEQALKMFKIANALNLKVVSAGYQGTETCVMYGDDEEILICGIDFPREVMTQNEIPLTEFVERMLNMHK